MVIETFCLNGRVGDIGIKDKTIEIKLVFPNEERTEDELTFLYPIKRGGLATVRIFKAVNREYQPGRRRVDRDPVGTPLLPGISTKEECHGCGKMVDVVNEPFYAKPGRPGEKEIILCDPCYMVPQPEEIIPEEPPKGDGGEAAGNEKPGGAGQASAEEAPPGDEEAARESRPVPPPPENQSESEETQEEPEPVEDRDFRDEAGNVVFLDEDGRKALILEEDSLFCAFRIKHSGAQLRIREIPPFPTKEEAETRLIEFALLSGWATPAETVRGGKEAAEGEG